MFYPMFSMRDLRSLILSVVVATLFLGEGSSDLRAFVALRVAKELFRLFGEIDLKRWGIRGMNLTLGGLILRS